jgi:hypothetical protein
LAFLLTAETLRAQRGFILLLSGERPESKKELPCGAFIPCYLRVIL